MQRSINNVLRKSERAKSSERKIHTNLHSNSIMATKHKVIILVIFLFLVVIGATLIGQVSANSHGREADCEDGPDSSYVEQLISDEGADCDPSSQADLIRHVENKNTPDIDIEKQTLDYSERTDIQVEIWHDDPNVNYNCQMRTRNGEEQNEWTGFREVSREDAGPPTILTQSIVAPRERVTSQTSVTVVVEVYCYAPASGDPYGVVFSDDWISQGFWSETLSYTYPTRQSIDAQQEEQESDSTSEEETRSSEQQQTPQSTQEQVSNTQEESSNIQNNTPQDEFQRGFFTNNPNSSLSFLNDPFNITTIGFILSIIGILLQLRRGV